jgi:hypothetical protein
MLKAVGDGANLATGRGPYGHGKGTPPDGTRITVWDLRTRRARAVVIVGAARVGSIEVDGLALSGTT